MSVILVDENISIKKVKSFYEQLKTDAEKQSSIVLDFSQVRRVDLSVIQLLISFQSYMKEKSKTVKIKNVSGELKQQLKITGLAR